MTEFRVGAVNRASQATPEPGGKAAHVAMALRALGERPGWIGFAGGSTGEFLIRGLKALGIQTLPIAIREPTRENLAIVDDAGTVTEILEPGGKSSVKELRSFQKVCEGEFARGKRKLSVIFSGSLPPGVPASFCASLIRAAHSHNCQVILDSSGDTLRRGVRARPDLVKPNRDEAEALTAMTIRDARSAREALARILAMGARSVAISLGKEGLIWGGENEVVWQGRPPEVNCRSAVGSGDAAVAGFAYGMSNGLSPEETLELAVACGSANCLADSPGRIRLSAVRKLQKEVSVEVLAG